jgi:8-oxo-dGTP pyrophosphatase MutT (NUDIX family)
MEVQRACIAPASFLRRPCVVPVSPGGRANGRACLPRMQRILTGGDGSPALDAATVVLLRDVGSGLECLMLRKNAGQTFGGKWVFPGGRVEPADGAGLDGARRATVREVVEETGLVIEPGELVPLSHWMPPSEAPRRFATWFFLAALPEGASDVVVDGGEIGDQMWTGATKALDRHRDGEISLVPPTWITLRWLADQATVDGALAAARGRDVEHFATHIVDDEGTLVSVWAPDAGYESGDLAAAGPRHRLYLDPAGWRYERWDADRATP